VIAGILGRVRRVARAPIVPWLRLGRELLDTVPSIRRAFQLPRGAGRRRAGGTRPLRVGVDIRPFYEPLTGVGWYLHHLLEELVRRTEVELVLFGETMTTDTGARLHAPVPGGLPVVTVDLRGVKLTRLSRPAAAAAYAASARAARCDLFFGANYFLPRALSTVATRRVVTIHDLTFRRFPHLLQEETLQNLNREIARELFRADAAICVSEATRRDLIEFFAIDPRKAVTVHSGLAAMPAPAQRPAGLPAHYLLFVSTIEPRKDLGTLLTAFETLRDRGEYAGDLVIVGKVGWKSEEVMRRIATSRWRSAIHHLDYVDRNELAGIYAYAQAFIFPSIYEGFGFPLLEAMAQGVPAIASHSSSLPEIGGEAALFFEPGDATHLADCLRRVLQDEVLRRELIERGLTRAGEFQWSRTADETLAVFRRAAESGR
jgi:glycosyltransferase involved in cell wall biosynthesis